MQKCPPPIKSSQENKKCGFQIAHVQFCQHTDRHENYEANSSNNPQCWIMGKSSCLRCCGMYFMLDIMVLQKIHWKKNTFQQKFQFEVRCPFTKLNTWKAPIACFPLMCCHVFPSSLHSWYLEVNKVQLVKFFLLYPIIFHPSPTPCRLCFSPHCALSRRPKLS